MKCGFDRSFRKIAVCEENHRAEITVHLSLANPRHFLFGFHLKKNENNYYRVQLQFAGVAINMESMLKLLFS